MSELRQLGGALADEAADGGALSHLEGAYAYYAVGVPADEGQAAAMRRYLTRARTALAPWDTGSVDDLPPGVTLTGIDGSAPLG